MRPCYVPSGSTPEPEPAPSVAPVSMTSPLPDKAADTTAEQPWPVRVLSLKISDYVDRMSQLWVEGQVVQFNPVAARPS